MIEEFFELVALGIASIITSLMVTTPATFKINCDHGFVVGGVDLKGTITCMEKIKEPCCGEPTGIVCERACKPTKTKYKRIYCTNGFRPVVKDHTTVGCTR